VSESAAGDRASAVMAKKKKKRNDDDDAMAARTASEMRWYGGDRNEWVQVQEERR
jgi:hypothetical protein